MCRTKTILLSGILALFVPLFVFFYLSNNKVSAATNEGTFTYCSSGGCGGTSTPGAIYNNFAADGYAATLNLTSTEGSTGVWSNTVSTPITLTINACSPSTGEYLEQGSSSVKVSIGGSYQDAANAYLSNYSSGPTSYPSCNKGVTPTSHDIQAILNLVSIPGGGTGGSITVGPASVNLEDSSGKVLSTVQTNTDTDAGAANTGQIETSSNGFANITPGSYKICTSDLTPQPNCTTLTSSQFTGSDPLMVNLTGTPVSNIVATGGIQTGTSAAGGFDTECDDSGGPFSWFICSAIDFTRDVEGDLINNVVVPLLTTQTINFNASSTCSASESSQQCNQDQLSSTIYKVWSSFRIFGDIVLVIAILAAVFAETIGGGQIEAYSVKKLLPKILAAAILINLSIYIVAGLEDVFNIFGKGLLSLIDAPFLGLAHVTISGGVGLIASVGIGGLVLVGAVGEGIIGVLLFVVGSFLLAALGVVITIMFRQALLVLLLLISPIAFALYCLPNTERYFRQWWDLLIKTLAVYPIVMALIAMSNIAYVVVNSFNITPTILAQLMGIMAAVAPLFVIPFAFKLSGGAIGGVYSGVSNLRDRVRQPINNARQANRNTRMERARTNNLYRGENRFARRASTIVQGAMLAPRAGLNPRRMRGRFEAVKSATTSANAARAGESQAAVAVLSNDDMLNASLHGNGTEADARAYLSNLGQTGRELDQNVAAITQARREMGRDAYNDAAVVANAGTGTGYGGGPGEMLEAINRVAGADRARAARLMAGARSQAERARRVDLYGSGFATSADQMTQLYNGHTNAAQVNIVMTDEGLMTKSAGEVGSSRNNAVNNMIPAMQRRVLAAQNAVADAVNNPTVADAGGRVGQTKLLYAQRQQKQALAAIANTLDVASQLAPENAVDLADGLMSRPATRYELRTVQNAQGLAVNTQVPITETLTQIMEHYRPDPEFQQMRREWQAGYQQGQQPPLGPLGGPQPPLGPQPPAPGQQFGPQGPI